MAWMEIWPPLCDNLAWVCVMFGLFSLCVLANIIAGTYYHVRHIGQRFYKSRLVTSVLKMLAIGVSTALLAVVATLAPLVLNHLGLINEDFSKLVSVALIIGMYVRAIVKYFTRAIATLDHILQDRDVVKELEPSIAENLQPEVEPETQIAQK